MAFSWPTHLVIPHPIGGAAKLQAQTDSSAFAIRAVLHPAILPVPPATEPAGVDPLNPPAGSVVVDLEVNTRLWIGMAWSAQGATRCSWFAKATTGGAWEAGPVDEITLPASLSVDVPIPLDWIVNRLTDYAIAHPPFRSKPFSVAKSYPRDSTSWPTASVQVDSFSPAERVVGDLLASEGPLVGSMQRLGQAYSLSFGITVWCATPEDRSVLTPWLAGAMEALKFCCREFSGLQNPTASLSEAEDFQTLQVPAFIAQGRFTGTVWTSLNFTIPSTNGRVTVP